MTDQTVQAPATDTTNAAATQTQTTEPITSTEVVKTEAQVSIPEKYELKLSENSMVDKSYLESFQAYAKEKKLTQEQAQEVLSREESLAKSVVDKRVSEFETVKSQWVDQAKQDPEIGGDNFQKNVELAHRALEKYSTPQFIEVLNSTGYGNHPELVRIFARIGKAISEDKMISPNANSGGKKTYEEIFYGQ